MSVQSAKLRAYAHQHRIRACAAWSDVLDKHGVIDESKAKYAQSCEQQLTKSIDDLANALAAIQSATHADRDAEGKL